MIRYELTDGKIKEPMAHVYLKAGIKDYKKSTIPLILEESVFGYSIRPLYAMFYIMSQPKDMLAAAVNVSFLCRLRMWG